MTDLSKEFEFLRIAQNLKTEGRHCWYEGGRQESVAEHSWRLALMVMRYHDRLDQKVDLFRCLKMAIVHDLGEAIVGDVSLTEQTEDIKKQKDAAEAAAMQQIKTLLGDANGDELLAIWQEYEDRQTLEAKFVKCLDRLEAFIQHNDSPLETFEYVEKEMYFQGKWLQDLCAYDSFLLKMADEVSARGIQKLIDAGEDVEAIKRTALKEAA